MIRLSKLLLLLTVLGGTLLGILTAQTPKPMSLEKTLRANRWQKRVLLLAAPTAEQADFRQQKALLATQATALNARDFLVLEVFYQQLSEADTQFLTRKIGLRPPAFAAVLIGKDGGVKKRSTKPIAPQSLFDIVDQMPMRRQEMR